MAIIPPVKSPVFINFPIDEHEMNEDTPISKDPTMPLTTCCPDISPICLQLVNVSPPSPTAIIPAECPVSPLAFTSPFIEIFSRLQPVAIPIVPPTFPSEAVIVPTIVPSVKDPFFTSPKAPPMISLPVTSLIVENVEMVASEFCPIRPPIRLVPDTPPAMVAWSVVTVVLDICPANPPTYVSPDTTSVISTFRLSSVELEIMPAKTPTYWLPFTDEPFRVRLVIVAPSIWPKKPMKEEERLIISPLMVLLLPRSLPLKAEDSTPMGCQPCLGLFSSIQLVRSKSFINRKTTPS